MGVALRHLQHLFGEGSISGLPDRELLRGRRFRGMREMHQPGFAIRQMMVAVAAVALVFGIFAGCLRWLRYPHINVTVFNETSTPLRDLRVSFMHGERTAERLRPGSVAVAEIQSGGDAGIFFSYRDSGGTLRKAEPLYYESGDRGFVEIHVTDKGARLVNGIYAGGGEIPILGVRRVRPTGQMTVKELRGGDFAGHTRR